MSNQSETVIEYPNGRRVQITEEGLELSRRTEAPNYFAPIDVIADPFLAIPMLSKVELDAFDRDIEASNKAIAAALKFDAIPPASEDATHAAADALLAIIALQKACMRMIETSTPINRTECEAFVAYGRDRLQVVAVSAACLPKGR